VGFNEIYCNIIQDGLEFGIKNGEFVETVWWCTKKVWMGS